MIITTPPPEGPEAFTILPSDESEFDALPEETQTEILRWLRVFTVLANRPANTIVTPIITQIARSIGVSTATALAKWNAFEATITTELPLGDFRALVP